jgi:NTP pyrophosphatase (non-canonical NTP hydrolase)
MNASDFQKQAERTQIEKLDFKISDKEIFAVWGAIGLAGEAGEVADIIKKGVFHQHGLNIDKVAEELGDVLWYTAALCSTLGLDMSKVMENCIEKLKMRYPNGYSSVDSQRRVDAK